MQTWTLKTTGQNSACSILLGEQVLESLPEIWPKDCGRAALIGDDAVMALFGDRIRRALSSCAGQVLSLGFPPGEKSKRREMKAKLEDQLLAAGFDRHACIVALGGGVSLDLAGFVAATFKRGLASIYIPTSLLAQVDAAIGGKTGINTDAGKNLIGAFHMPRAVLIDPGLTLSLPTAEWQNGLAEMVKHAVIGDAALFSALERLALDLRQPTRISLEIMRRSLEVKIALVREDFLEQGARAWLNLGHTVGHALEAAGGYQMAHGLAVALGLFVESRIAAFRGLMSVAEAERIEDLLKALGFDLELPFDLDRILPHMKADKKNRDGAIHLVLPIEIGRMGRPLDGGYSYAVTQDEIREAWPA